jgi:tryptophan-rich sensory protein
MNAVFVLAVVIFAFGGIAAALVWSEAQNREPSK